MENFKKQTEPGKCGVYNLANALRNESILKYENDYIPCGNPEINRILEKEGYGMNIQPFISAVSWKSKIPKMFFISSVESLINESIKNGMDEKDSIIFITQIQCGKGEKNNHAVTLRYYRGSYYYSNPCNKGYEKLKNIKDIFNKCDYINMLNCFVNENGEYLSLYLDF